MDEQVLVATRRALHAVAEQVLAGPQYRSAGTIRLNITPGGFGQVKGPLRVEGDELVGERGRVPLRGTITGRLSSSRPRRRMVAGGESEFFLVFANGHPGIVAKGCDSRPTGGSRNSTVFQRARWSGAVSRLNSPERSRR